MKLIIDIDEQTYNKARIYNGIGNKRYTNCGVKEIDNE